MNKKLRIAMLVLPWIPLPPPGYAGTESVVYNLTEELVRRGHEVTLFSVGESKTSAHLESIFPKAFGLQPDVMKMLKSSFYPLMHVAHCFEKADQFDVIHSHAQFLALPFAAVCKRPTLHTFHRVFSFTTQDETDLVMRYGHLPFTSISNAQRIDGIQYVATVYNGIDTRTYVPVSNPKRDYLLWAGRLIDKKGPLEAIHVSQKTGIPLKLAGVVTEQDYFEKMIKPHIDGKHIELRADVDESGMITLYQNARVTLVPVKWNEPFGLVPVESMACGTPVIAYANGGVKETIIDGKTGYLISEDQGVEGLSRRIRDIAAMDRFQYEAMSQTGVSHVAQTFSIEAMTDGYEKAYADLVNHTQS